MRSAILLLLMLPPLVAQTQPDVWKRVDPRYNGPQLQSATLSNVQQRAIAQLILHCCKEDLGGTPTDVLRCLNFQEIPLSKGNILLLNEDGTECANAGTGGGGAMWLVRLDGDVPILLASPQDDFNGWIYSIQPSVSHGYRDLVLGWHMGAGMATLTYFQYNGKSYVSVSRAVNLCDRKGCRIDPNTAD
jgi:hypothetical protein